MAQRPHKVGTVFRDSFIYQDASGGVTGAVAGDFTIQISKNGTGNQATTGVVIAEVDATNNAGEYSITCNASTSFVASTGTYVITIFVTADPDNRWSITIPVTSTGLVDGSTGSALFTSSSGDGRVTDGASALEGAQVFIQDPSGVTRYELETDASGDWSVYLDTDGAWTAYAQASGYSQESGTITVSGATATGPGANLALTSTGGGSSVTYAELLGYARRMAMDASGTKADQILQEIINDAMMLVAESGEWEFLQSQGEIAFNGMYNTGTIAVNDGGTTVTLTGGTWPDWAASGEIVIEGQKYRVASRTSGSVIELSVAYISRDDTNLTAATYILFQDAYSLPSDCLRFHCFLQGRSAAWRAEPTSWPALTAMKASWDFSASYPSQYAIKGNKLYVYPAPSTDDRVNIIYYRRPARMTSPSDTMDFDVNQRSLVRRAIDYQISLRWGTNAGGQVPEHAWNALKKEIMRALHSNNRPVEPRHPQSGGRKSVINPFGIR